MCCSFFSSVLKQILGNRHFTECLVFKVVSSLQMLKIKAVCISATGGQTSTFYLSKGPYVQSQILSVLVLSEGNSPMFGQTLCSICVFSTETQPGHV